MSVDTEPQCIFKGSKFFWRTRNNIDINIIEHSDVGVYEVVLYEPAIDAEAKRVYLDEKVLKSKLNNDEIEEQVSFAKRNNIPITDLFVAGIQNKSIIEYLKSRTKIDKYIQEEKIIEASVHFTETDLAAGITDISLIIEKPEGLQPFIVKHHKLLMAGVVQEVLAAMQEDKKALQDCCETASELSELVDPTLSIRERWRMPLVICKVARRQQLNVGDRRIYKKFQANMKESEEAAGGNVPASLAPSGRSSTGSVLSIATPRSSVSRTRRGSKEEKEPTVSRGTSTLYADTANSRQRRSSSTDEAPTTVPKHRKGGRKLGSLVRHKKQAQTPRAGAKGSHGSMQSANTSGKSTARIVAGAESNSDSSDNSDNEDEEVISSHVQRLVAGLKTLGTAIKSSFSFITPVSNTIEPILEHDEHNNSVNNSVNQHVVKSKQSATATTPTSATHTGSAGDAFTCVAPAAVQWQGSGAPEQHQAAHTTITTSTTNPNTTTSTTTATTTAATDCAVLVEHSGPLRRVHNMHNTSGKYLDDSANSSESKVRTKPVKRKSYFGSFMQMLTGSSKPPTTTNTNSTSATSVTISSNTVKETANIAQQDSSSGSHLAIPALAHFLGAKSSSRIQPV